MPVLIRYCNKVGGRRNEGAANSMEQLAFQLLESAIEMRPSAAQAVDQLASVNLRGAGFKEEKAVGLDEAIQGQGEGNSPIGIRDGVQEDVAGAKLEPSSDQVGTKLEPPFQYNDHELFELQMTLKQFMDTLGDLTAFVQATRNLGKHQDNQEGQSGRRRHDNQKVHRWYHIAFAGCPKHKCQCKGNCVTGCPARAKPGERGSCPNPANWNLPRVWTGKAYNDKNVDNIGRCRSCWRLPPT